MTAYQVQLGDQTYEYTLRRSRKARHVLLHVDPEVGIEVVIPWRIPLQVAHQLVRDKQDWLARTIQKYNLDRPIKKKTELQTGALLPYLGEVKRLEVQYRPGRATVRRHGPVGLRVTAVNPSAARVALEKWYRREAAEYFTTVCGQLAAQLNTHFTKVTIRNTKTRWGSCTGRRLAFNWRLLLAPREVADYVAAHEVAHLEQANHSPAFLEISRIVGF